MVNKYFYCKQLNISKKPTGHLAPHQTQRNLHPHPPLHWSMTSLSTIQLANLPATRKFG